MSLAHVKGVAGKTLLLVAQPGTVVRCLGPQRQRCLKGNPVKSSPANNGGAERLLPHHGSIWSTGREGVFSNV
ncbi:uncharacterized protein LOC142776592 isoform X2 [Rhipicephalus microplus]|uniref:uncharacterized protein LOC142776592 isoform X2 n=1 Tax=Rhipicephalus microplus TaxID=6941 RepID=UPI003F6B6C2E